MIKKILFLFLILFLSFSVRNVFASGFNLKSIGGLNTDGREISHWWYSSTSAPLSGEAIPDSTVNITIDDQSSSVTADSSGNWTYDPGSLSEGDHSVSLENNDSTISFTLTLGADNVDWDAVGEEGSGSSLPTVGVITPTLILMSTGGLIFLGGQKLLRKN